MKIRHKILTFALFSTAFYSTANAENIAPLGQASATSTYCSGENPSAHCYDAIRVNDGDTSTTLGGYTSWANDINTSRPQTWQLLWPSFVQLHNATVYTSAGYPIQDFDLQYFDAYHDQWLTLQAVRGNKDLKIMIDFPSVYTDKLRVLAYSGPSHQTVYVRLNEVVVSGNADYL